MLEQIDHTGENLDPQIEDRINSLDTALDGLADNIENETRRPNVILDELSGLVRVPFRLDADQLTQLTSDPKDLSEELHAQVETYVTSMNITRLVNTIEFRLGESLGLNSIRTAGTRVGAGGNEDRRRRPAMCWSGVKRNFSGQTGKSFVNSTQPSSAYQDRR